MNRFYIGGENDEARPPESLASVSRLALALGFNFGLVLTENGSAASWGDNSYGQRSIPSLNELDLEARESRFVEVACGWAHSLLLTDAGMVFACGWNSDGQCGSKIDVTFRSPFHLVSVPTTSKIIRIAAGEKHSLLLDSDGKVWSIGSNSDHQLGLGDSDVKFSEIPLLVPIESSPILFDSEMDLDQMETILNDTETRSPANIKQICCGARHSLALDENGFVYGWGWSGYMQLGQNEMDDVASPGLIDLPEPIIKVSAGTWHSLFLGGPFSLHHLESGNVYCCGWGEDGQLGLPRQDETKTSAPTPRPVPFFAEAEIKVRDIAAGSRHSGFVSDSGKAYFCGKLPSNQYEPKPIDSTFNFSEMHASNSGLLFIS